MLTCPWCGAKPAYSDRRLALLVLTEHVKQEHFEKIVEYLEKDRKAFRYAKRKIVAELSGSLIGIGTDGKVYVSKAPNDFVTRIRSARSAQELVDTLAELHRYYEERREKVGDEESQLMEFQVRKLIDWLAYYVLRRYMKTHGEAVEEGSGREERLHLWIELE